MKACVRTGVAGLVGALAFLSVGTATAAEPLRNYNINASRISVSGLSSGAFMASQFHVAFSKSVMGAGVFAGGPFNCAAGTSGLPRATSFGPQTWTELAASPEPLLFGPFLIPPAGMFAEPFFSAPNSIMSYGGSPINWLGVTSCMWGAPALPDAGKLARDATALSPDKIDPVNNLRQSRIYLFTGTNDHTVVSPVVQTVGSFYRDIGVPAANISLSDQSPAGHGMPTVNYGVDCATTASPFINRCPDEDGAGKVLSWIYQDLRQPTGTAPASNVVSFDQKEFVNEPSGLASEGYLYVPNACPQGGCRLHVAFHGCKQTTQDIGKQFVTDTGYNKWAEANNIIVLYPQIQASYYPLQNPNGCWDWFGYTGKDYAMKAAPQMAAVKKMLDRLAGRQL